MNSLLLLLPLAIAHLAYIISESYLTQWLRDYIKERKWDFLYEGISCSVCVSTQLSLLTLLIVGVPFYSPGQYLKNLAIYILCSMALSYLSVIAKSLSDLLAIYSHIDSVDASDIL